MDDVADLDQQVQAGVAFFQLGQFVAHGVQCKVCRAKSKIQTRNRRGKLKVQNSKLKMSSKNQPSTRMAAWIQILLELIEGVPKVCACDWDDVGWADTEGVVPVEV
jgi:hypothetical protein